MNEIAFQGFPKMARFSRECLITEKIDGTNAQICIVPTTELFSAGSSYPEATVVEDFSKPGSVAIFAGSRTRWIQPGNDNYGFAAWVKANATELKKLGPGRHFGEWWGGGIQRGYGVHHKTFSLFNVNRWANWGNAGVSSVRTGETISCCKVVPILFRGEFTSHAVDNTIECLRRQGSYAQLGYLNPEGIVVWHCAAQVGFKKTLLNDESPKSFSGLPV
jgi:hypothetical protein